MRFLDAREWLEWVYANGRGDPADFAAELIDELFDIREAFNDLSDAVGDDPQAIRKQIEEHEAIGAMVGAMVDNAFHETEHLPSQIESGLASLEAIRCDYEAIVECLTEIGVLQDEATADIPALLRLLIAPA